MQSLFAKLVHMKAKNPVNHEDSERERRRRRRRKKEQPTAEEQKNFT
jgi:hypothetical protein